MQKVFVNRTLNLKRIKCLGFDMDHTLVRYKSANFEELAHNIMLKKLVSDRGYPDSILKLKFKFDRAIRGLVIDKKRGNVLKLSRHSAIRVSYHGLDPIDYSTQKKLYKSTYIDLRDSAYDTVDTTFSIAFAGLFMLLVDLKDKNPTLPLPDYQRIAEDLTLALDRGHRDGSIKDQVRAHLEDYIVKDEDAVRGLEKFKRHGKKLFIVTNSDYPYAKLLLDYTITPFLKDHESWQDLFDFVITLAHKPRFFIESSRFFKIDPQTGLMMNWEKPIENGIYQGGGANTFSHDLNLDADEILYIGDHIYGDIVRLKKDCAWRTALVVEELENEIEKIAQASPLSQQITELMNKKLPLEAKLDDLLSEDIEHKTTKNERISSELLRQINEIDKEISPLIKKQQKLFNPLWGEVMRAGIEESYFAYQVDRFACVYFSKLADFLDLSPRTYFRSWRKPMAHDRQLSADDL